MMPVQNLPADQKGIFYNQNQNKNIMLDEKILKLRNDLLLVRVSNGFVRADQKSQLISNGASIEDIESVELSTTRLYGGGIAGGSEAKKSNTCVFEVKEGSSITIEAKDSGQLRYILVLPSEEEILLNDVVINGKSINSMPKSDRDELIELLKQIRQPNLTGQYDSNFKTFFISSRPEQPKLIEVGEHKELVVYYSIIEKLDEDYVDCVAAYNSPNISESDAHMLINKFVQTYENMLEKANWEEERIDIMIRKATIDGLRISLIPTDQYKTIDKACKDVVRQFNLIEKEIKLLNLSLDTKESLDFHMYRGFVYSKYPATYYPNERKIAISDAMIVISLIQQNIESKLIKFSHAFYKKMASAFTVFAKGIENPPVSMKFVTLGLEFIQLHEKMTHMNDSSLDILRSKLIQLKKEFDKNLIEIKIQEDIQADQDVPMEKSIEVNLSSIEKSVDQMEKIDKILFRTFQDYNNPSQVISNCQRSIKAYNDYMLEEQSPNQIFRAKLRSLFLGSYLNYLTNYQNVNLFQKTFDKIVIEFKELGRKIPEDINCYGELCLFRGGVCITYPRTGLSNQNYDLAIKDFNEITDKGIYLHNDIKAFQYMLYGQHMLKYDPISATKLLKQALNLTKCDTIRVTSEHLLKEFYNSFNPVHPQLSFKFEDTKMLNF